MASGGGLGENFKKFATKGNGTECTTKDITRWLTDAGGIFGKNCSSNNMDIAFSKVKTKGKPTITMNELMPLIKEIAKAYQKDKKLESEEDAVNEIVGKLTDASKEAHGATKQSKTGNVDHFTDSSQYTGAHKSRFDEDGHGKGIEGRADVTDNSGYVGNYKGAETYDKKHEE